MNNRFDHQQLKFLDLTESDHHDFMSLYRNPRALQHITERPIDKQAQMLFEQIVARKSDLQFRKITNTRNDFIGLIGLTLENAYQGRSHHHSQAMFGMIIEPQWFGKGIGTYALTCLLKMGFQDYELQRMYASFRQANQAIHHVVNKVGLTIEGRRWDKAGHPILDCAMTFPAFTQQYGNKV